MSNLFAKKDVNKLLEENAAKESTKTLGLFDVILMGVGATIGTGVLVIAGLVAARDAGPSVSISFVISAVACILVALCYAEFGSAIPSSGGAYTYIYVSLGKFVAHLIGWSIVGCYTVSLASVAGGWSSYVNNVLTEFGIRLPESFTAIPSNGGIINLPAVFIVLCMSFLLTRGVKESKKINNLMVLIKIGIVLLFVAVGVFFIHTNNWHPFTPFGVKGIFAGAASVFFAYNGFDAISTSAEEVKNPQRNLPLGILIALSVCAVIYVVIALVLTGMVSYKELNVGDALSYALNSVGQEWAALIVSIGAVIGIMAVVFAYLFVVPRILMSMSHDGLLPSLFAKVNRKNSEPVISTWLVGALGAIVAGFVDLKQLADLANMLAIVTFAAVSFSILALRKTQPNLKRGFKVPFVPFIPIIAILCCIFLMFNLSMKTWMYSIGWMLIGVFIYVGYGRNKKSV